MDLILGMDIWVFLAWIGTILAAILCVIYGIYHHFIKKSNDSNESKKASLRKKEEK